MIRDKAIEEKKNGHTAAEIFCRMCGSWFDQLGGTEAVFDAVDGQQGNQKYGRDDGNPVV